MTYFATPAADPQEFLQMMQPFQQPPGCQMDPGPDQSYHYGTQNRPVPIGCERLAEKKMGDPCYFRQPRKHNQYREAEGLNPEDGVRAFLGLFHKFYCASARKFCPAKVTLLDTTAPGH
jgi:hypothetical protein